MPLFSCSGRVVGSKYLGIFRAETKEDAEEKALTSNGASVNLCHECSTECEDAEVDEVFAEPIDESDVGDEEIIE